MRCHPFAVGVVQLLGSLQVWFVPCLIASFYFRGTPTFYIIIASLLCLPIFFNLIVVSHYWYRSLLIAGLFANAVGGLGAIGTVIASWSSPRYRYPEYASPKFPEAVVMMLIVAASMCFTAAMDLALLATSRSADSSYSCCWGNTVGPSSNNVRAPPRFVHIIRTMRVMTVIVFAANFIQLWSFAVWQYPYSAGSHSYSTSQTELILDLRILSLFYFVMTLLWSIIAFVLSFNINSSRKLRFMGFNTILVLVISGFFAVVHLLMGIRAFKAKGVGPAPWTNIAILPFEFTWLLCALYLAYSRFPFRPNSCCWPDCTAPSNLEEEFDVWVEHRDENDGL